jgi:hypothetical protein
MRPALGLVLALSSAAHAEPTIEPKELLGALPDRAEVARRVARRGFWDGEPIGVAACAGCHADVVAGWQSSAHRFSSFNNPYYRVSVDAFRHERGARATRFCAGCHEPALANALAVDRASPEAQAGITCLVCHSIDAVSLEGNGGWHARLDTPAPGKEGHRARYRRPILDEAQLCAGCHKVGLRPDITRDRWLRGQDDWDAWGGSAASGNGAASVFRPTPQRCQDCHMPLEPAVLGDAAAHDGMIRSHRFLGANAALPSLRGDDAHRARTIELLRGKASLDLAWIDARTVDAVLRARGVGHRFPGGTMDSNEVWLEVRAVSTDGKLMALDASHFVRAQPVDGDGRPLARRDPQHMRGVAFDASLLPSDPQAVRYRLPEGTATVEARLLYRKFSRDYARAACGKLPHPTRAACEAIPVVEIARATLEAAAPPTDDSQRLLEHGLALADATADRAAEAEPLLTAARARLPVEATLGLMRLALRLGQTDEVVALAPAAGDHPAALWLTALALTRAYRPAAARTPVERLVEKLPRDRNALLLAARVRGLDGDPAGALKAAERAAALDPDLDEAHYHRALALAELGRTDDAERAQQRYLDRRVAVEIDLALRRRWNARHTVDESEPVHTHVLPAARSIIRP